MLVIIPYMDPMGYANISFFIIFWHVILEKPRHLHKKSSKPPLDLLQGPHSQSLIWRLSQALSSICAVHFPMEGSESHKTQECSCHGLDLFAAVQFKTNLNQLGREGLVNAQRKSILTGNKKRINFNTTIICKSSAQFEICQNNGILT